MKEVKHKNLILNRIKLTNFLSHKDTEIIFHENQKLLIDGESGSGKSSIFEAIIWALYGEGRADNKTLVRKEHGGSTKKASVELTLCDTAQEQPVSYIITRSVTMKGKHTLEVRIVENGSTTMHPLSGVRELQSWIEKELIGASYLFFVNSIAYLQGGSETFVMQNAAKRKELLLEILQTNNFDELYEKTRNTIKDKEVLLSFAEVELNGLTSRTNELKQKLESYGDIDDELNNVRNKIKKNEETLKKIESELSQEESKAQKIEMQKKLVKQLEDQLKLLKHELHDSLQAKKEFDEINKENDSLIADIENQIKSVKEDIATKEAMLNHERDIGRKYYQKMLEKPKVNDYSDILKVLKEQIRNASLSKKCPAGKDCPHEHEIYQKAESAKSEVNKIAHKIIEEQGQLKEWEKDISTFKKPDDATIKEMEGVITALRSKLESLEKEKTVLENKNLRKDFLREKVDKVKELEGRISTIENGDLRTEKEKLEKAISTYSVNTFNELKGKRNVLAEQIQTLRTKESNLIGIKTEIKLMHEEIVKNESAIEDALKSKKSLESDIKKLLLLKDAFGSSGIRAMVIDYLLPKLEESINDVLSQMSDFRVRLDTQKEKASGDGMKEGLFVTIINEFGQEMPFESYSGGEKLKIIVAFSEALAMLQHVGFRLFDEVFVGLDENSTESFASVLERLQHRFNQVLCISHMQQIKDMFDEKLFINKRNSISYVQQ